MRLTLRTLLAYLDDTLDPNDIKHIGQKVAESDAAQELVARLRQVTRRRRLTTPPATGPGSFEPNTVAEYLDNALSSEEISEVEKLCLESDVHLAEIAACHQILTLVLGEPALVPPSARKRMYALVRGRESTRRKPAPTRTRLEEEVPVTPEPEEGDEALLLGLPSYGKQAGWLKWALAGSAVLLIALLALAIYSALPPSPTQPRLASHSSSDTGTRPAPTQPVEPRETTPEPKTTTPAVKETMPEVKATTPEVKTTRPTIKDPDAEKERREIGQAIRVSKPYPNLLLARQQGRDEWTRVTPEKTVYTSDSLVVLPGYRAGIHHNSGAELFLWGNLPELLKAPLLDAAIVIHNKPDVDLDFTLQRGRVLITNRKEQGELTTRMTFNEEAGKTPEVWELTLHEPGTEVAVDVLGGYARETGFNSGEGPLCALFLVVLRGQATIKVDRQTFRPPPESASYMTWDNKNVGVGGPLPMDPKALEFWNKSFANTPQAAETVRALNELVSRPENVSIEVMLEESLTSEKPATRNMAVYGLGSLDNLSKLLDVLADQEERFADMRDAAIISLRSWIGRRIENDKELYDFMLNRKKFKEREAVTAMQLLHDFRDEDLKKPETWQFLIFCIKDRRPMIRELAYWHLIRLVPGTRQPKYYPGGDSEKPERAFAEWQKLIPDGGLPNRGGN